LQMYPVQSGLQPDIRHAAGTQHHHQSHQQHQHHEQHGPGPYQHLNLRNYIPDNIKTGITDEQLVLKPTKDLNKMLKNTGLAQEDVNKIKQKRRTLKNRGYAASCRNKREQEEESLKLDLENLKKDIDELKRTSIEKRRQLKEMRECFEFRQEWAKKEPHIKLPEHLLQPLPPIHGDPVN